MLKKIIDRLRDRLHNAQQEREVLFAAQVAGGILDAVERNKEAEAMSHWDRSEMIEELLDKLHKNKVASKDTSLVAARLSSLISAHVRAIQDAASNAQAKCRETEERIERELRFARMDAEQDRIVHDFVQTHKRILLENQTLFSKDEWLARAAEGKRYPHNEDELLGVPDDVIEEAKMCFENYKHERIEIVRHNGPYMITANAKGVTVLKDVLAGVGGISERESFEPVTAEQRKYAAALREQQMNHVGGAA